MVKAHADVCAEETRGEVEGCSTTGGVYQTVSPAEYLGGAAGPPFKRWRVQSVAPSSLSPRVSSHENPTRHSPTIWIKSEPQEPSLAGISTEPTLLTSGVYRITPIPKLEKKSDRNAWRMAQVQDFERRVQSVGLVVKVNSHRLLSDGLAINWSSASLVGVSGDGFPCSPTTARSSIDSPVETCRNVNCEPTLVPAVSRPHPADCSPHLGPCPSHTVFHLPTPSLSPPLPHRQLADQPLSDECSKQTTLFAMHKQQHVSSQVGLVGLSLPPEGLPPVRSLVAPPSFDADSTSPINVDADSADELYLSWEEHERMTQARMSGVTPFDPVDSLVGLSDPHTAPLEAGGQPHRSSPSPALNGMTSPWSEAKIEQLQVEATEWLKNYIHTFDTDRSDLAPAYSQHAIFSLREFSYLTLPPTIPARPPQAHVGTVSILAALLDLPDSFSFNLRNAAPQISYDIVVLFDIFVYAQAHTPGVMLTCYVDPARRPSVDEERRWRWVCEMRFVLRPNTWSEDDSSTGGLWRLIAVSHQMTLRKIPLSMDWNWK